MPTLAELQRDMNRNWGNNPEYNKQLAQVTGYSGDFGSGLFGNWLSGQGQDIWAKAAPLLMQRDKALPSFMSGLDPARLDPREWNGEFNGYQTPLNPGLDRTLPIAGASIRDLGGGYSFNPSTGMITDPNGKQWNNSVEQAFAPGLQTPNSSYIDNGPDRLDPLEWGGASYPTLPGQGAEKVYRTFDEWLQAQGIQKQETDERTNYYRTDPNSDTGRTWVSLEELNQQALAAPGSPGQEYTFTGPDGQEYVVLAGRNADNGSLAQWGIGPGAAGTAKSKWGDTGVLRSIADAIGSSTRSKWDMVTTPILGAIGLYGAGNLIGGSGLLNPTDLGSFPPDITSPGNGWIGAGGIEPIGTGIGFTPAPNQGPVPTPVDPWVTPPSVPTPGTTPGTTPPTFTPAPNQGPVPQPVDPWITPPVGTTPGASPTVPGVGGVISQLFPPGSTIPQWLSALLPSVLGAVGANAQTDAYERMANKYLELGAPYRAKLLESYQPGFDLTSIDPGFKGALDTAAETSSRALSTRFGNTAQSPTSLAEMQKYLIGSTYLPYITNYRSGLSGAGGLGVGPAAQASYGAAQGSGGIWESIGRGANAVLNPPQQKIPIDLGGGNIIYI